MRKRPQKTSPFVEYDDFPNQRGTFDPQGLSDYLDKKPDIERLWLSCGGGRDWSVLRRMTNVRQLSVNCYKHPDFSPLASLTKLEHLFLNVYGRAADLIPVSLLGNLVSLDIYGATRIRDVSPLANLPNLKHFRLWTFVGEFVLDSTGQCEVLTRLETLLLHSTRFRKGSIRVFSKLSNLKSLHLDNRFPWQDCAWLSGCMPNTECWLFEPTWSDNNIPCEKCGTGVLQLIGARRAWACPRCANDRIAKHIKSFEEYRACATGGAVGGSIKRS